MASLTVKQVDEGLLQRLREQSRRRGQSMNTFIRELLARAVGYEPGRTTYDDLSDLAGAWSEEDQREFDEQTRPFREVDPSLWA